MLTTMALNSGRTLPHLPILKEGRMATEGSREKKRNNIQQCHPMIIHTCSLMCCPEPVRACCTAAGQRHFRDPGKLLPDAVFVGYGNAGRERVELHHGGDARVPVEEDLIIQPGNTCRGIEGSHSSVPGNIPPEGQGSDPPKLPGAMCHHSPPPSSQIPVIWQPRLLHADCHAS